MRYTAEHKQATRERILTAAARQFRERGFTETGVASIMKEADLTHGGFYAHFDSKDDLIAEVIRDGFTGVSDSFEALFDSYEGDNWLRAWVEGYLSDEHCSHVADGCPLPSLASEIARSGPEARAAFTQTCFDRLDKIRTKVNADTPEAEKRVIAAVAQMAGALMLSRAVDEPLATRFREAAIDGALTQLLHGFDTTDPIPTRGEQ